MDFKVFLLHVSPPLSSAEGMLDIAETGGEINSLELMGFI